MSVEIKAEYLLNKRWDIVIRAIDVLVKKSGITSEELKMAKFFISIEKDKINE